MTGGRLGASFRGLFSPGKTGRETPSPMFGKPPPLGSSLRACFLPKNYAKQRPQCYLVFLRIARNELRIYLATLGSSFRALFSPGQTWLWPAGWSWLAERGWPAGWLACLLAGCCLWAGRHAVSCDARLYVNFHYTQDGVLGCLAGEKSTGFFTRQRFNVEFE